MIFQGEKVLLLHTHMSFMPGIFICHSSKDKVIANQIGKDLKKAGIKIWIDEAEIRGGDSLLGRISSAIEQIDFVGALLSPNSVRSKWCKLELEMAMNKELKENEIVVIPILIKECDIPPYIKIKNYIDVRGNNYTEGLLKLIKSIYSHNESRSKSAKKEDIIQKPSIPKRVKLGPNKSREFSLGYLYEGVFIEGFLKEKDGDNFFFEILDQTNYVKKINRKRYRPLISDGKKGAFEFTEEVKNPGNYHLILKSRATYNDRIIEGKISIIPKKVETKKSTPKTLLPITPRRKKFFG